MKSHISINRAWEIVRRFQITPHKTQFKINKHLRVILKPSTDGWIDIQLIGSDGWILYTEEKLDYLTMELHRQINSHVRQTCRSMKDFMTALGLKEEREQSP